jgi:hypothetical protein
MQEARSNAGFFFCSIISTDAMDQIEGTSRTQPAHREQQFLRPRDHLGGHGAARRGNSATSNWRAVPPA